MARLFTALVFVSLFASCSRRYEVATQGQLFTLTNLHVDRRGDVTNLNYLDGSLLPACTPVEIERVAGREIRFRSAAGRYRFVATRHSRTTIDVHAQRLFASSCTDLSTLSGPDLSGVQSGAVYDGMTRTGVLLALGYPPDHETQSLEVPVWKYFRTRSQPVEVFFQGDVVVGTRDVRAVRRAERQLEREAQHSPQPTVTIDPAGATPLVVAASQGCRVPSQDRCYFPMEADECGRLSSVVEAPTEPGPCSLAAVGRCDFGNGRGYLAYQESRQHCEMLQATWRPGE